MRNVVRSGVQTLIVAQIWDKDGKTFRNLDTARQVGVVIECGLSAT